MLNTPRRSTLILSSGSTFDDYRPAVADDFPVNSTAWITCYDSTGNIITKIDATQVTPRQMLWEEIDSDLHDMVPNGAQYEVFIKIPGVRKPYKYEYGTVIRREAAFFAPPPTSLEGESRLFVDSLGRSSLGRRWQPVRGGTAMHDLGGGVFGMGPDVGLLFAQSAVRYFRPLGGDSFRAKFYVASTNFPLGAAGTGKMQFIANMDINMSIGMGFEIETGLVTKQLHTGIVNGPTDLTYTGAPIANTVVTGDYFTVDYSDQTAMLNVYKGSDLVNPVISWNDSSRVLPKGDGYRYWGFAWDASLIATGPLLTSIEVQDYV